MNKFLNTAIVLMVVFLLFKLVKPSNEDEHAEHEKDKASHINLKHENTSINSKKGNLEAENDQSVRRIQIKGRDSPESKLEDLLGENERLSDLKEEMNKRNDELKNEIGEIKAKITRQKVEQGEIEFQTYENDIEKVKAKCEIIIPRFKAMDSDFKDIMEKLKELSKRMDPFEEGIEVSSITEHSNTERLFNFDFENMPIGEIVRYLGIATNYKYKMTPHGFEFAIPEAKEDDNILDPFGDKGNSPEITVREEKPVLRRIESIEKWNQSLQKVMEDLQKEQDALNKQKIKFLKEADSLGVF